MATTVAASSRRNQLAWALYDWASGPFIITVASVFLGPYLTNLAKAGADSAGMVHIAGLTVAAGALFPYTVSFSVLLQLLVMPVAGAVGDSWGHKKLMFGAFAYAGALAAGGLYFLRGTNYGLGAALFVVANVAYGASFVMYDSFLNEVAAADERHRVSALGWSLGALASGLLLLANVVAVAKAGALGLTTADAVRISLASAGVWWAVFAVIPLVGIRLPARAAPARSSGLAWLTRGYRDLPRYRQSMWFLIAYLIYNDGVQTVATMASQFGQEELHISIDVIASVVLLAQFVGMLSTFGSIQLAKRIGGKAAICASLLLWTAAVVYAYGWLYTTAQYVGVGVVFAVAWGGTQSLSRSLFSLLIPRGREAEYFGVFMISSRGTSWLGPLLFGLALQFSHSYRVALVSLVVFFLTGMAVLLRVNVEQGALQAAAEPGGDNALTARSIAAVAGAYD